MSPILYFLIMCNILCVSADYWYDRKKMIQNEEELIIGSHLSLSSKENRVNRLLMSAKEIEINEGFLHPETFPPARHFFHSRADIQKSAVFKFISKMPKGGALHVHDTALSSTDYVLKNITYRDNLYACISEDEIRFKFIETPPSDECWQLVKDMRNRNKCFDTWLRNKLTLVTDNPYEKYPDINTVWKAFIKIFSSITPLISYRPVFEDYFYNALEEFYKDNVNYVEVRGTLPPVYELNGNTYDPKQVLGILKKVADRFVLNHPDFLGVKYIYAPVRSVNNYIMDEYIEIFKKMQTAYPDFLVGFDLVGQEDLGPPLINFINQLKNISKVTNFYFHAGETNWNGMSTDLNLIDAVLLNATRIGHGYALLKHPMVLDLVKRRQIAIEVNPISNQVLNLVKDLRNHPANYLIAQNYPVVISSDDPGLWDSSGLSYDFYVVFMGMASKHADLKLLKQLAFNSLLYSSLSNKNKRIAKKKFVFLWNKFINETLNNRYTYTIFSEQKCPDKVDL